MLTGVARTFADHELIVSKTDPRGIITYANSMFLRIADYELEEVLGKPHNIIRHPDMPKVLYRLLWQRLKSGKEIFAYVMNRTKYGDHYWVLAHATASFDKDGTIVGAHSNRRSPRPEAIRKIEPIYAQLRQEEARYNTANEGMEASMALLNKLLAEKGVGYDEFILSL